MSHPPIAVVGLGALMPGSDDVAGFWRTLVEGVDCLSDVPEAHWRVADYYDPTPRAADKTYGRRGGFIAPQPFDPVAFGLPPATLPSTDVAQLLALLLAQRCLADADNGPAPRFDRQRTSVILGVAATTQLVAHMSGRMARPMWREGMRTAGLDDATIERTCDAIAAQFVPWQESTFPGLLANVIAGRIANRFDLGGTNCVLDAACASSMAAVAMAIGELRSGRADTVLTGGVDALNDVLMFLCFSQTPALSPTGDCRPFSDRADGTMLGEGIGMLALRRLEDAERDGHRIYAVIRGLGTSSDGRAKSVYAPRAEGQVLALRRAYEEAGYSPSTVTLMEAHGTGTVAGDAAEVAALTEVFSQAAADGSEAAGESRWCALGSVKSQIGHTKAAAGAASLVKAVLALQHRILPPTIKVEQPSPALGLETSPFYLNATTRPWFRRAAHPRRASVSSFGFGGSNFHIALEEYRGAALAPRLDAAPVRLLLLSASEPGGLVAELAGLPGRLRTAAHLAAFARASHTAFAFDAAIRLALVVEDVAQLRRVCEEASALVTNGVTDGMAEGRTAHAVLRRGAGVAAESIAFVCPGQGSQYLGMGGDLAVYFEAAFDAWEHAVDVIGVAGDGADDAIDLGEVVFPRATFDAAARERADARLRATRWAQPALAAASLAQLALLERLGVRPAAVAGHSFGELTALHAAGGFDAGTLVRLARARGMAIEACIRATDPDHPEAGSMLAVSADAGAVQRIVERHAGRGVVIANDNHPRQTVLSGPAASLTAIAAELAETGISSQSLNVAAAFHSPLVAAAAATFASDVAGSAVHAPRIPVIGNATARPYGQAAADIKTQLSEQLARPVRFRETVDELYELGCRVFVEVGAGDVLTGLVGKCLTDRPHVAIALDRRGDHGLRTWWRGIAELATLGVPMRLDALHEPLAPAVPEPAGPAVVYVSGAHFGKPYPPAGAPATAPQPTQYPATREPVATSTPVPHVERRPASLPMSDSSLPPAPAYVRAEDRAGDLHAQILEAQRLTQQALLESLAMTLRGLGGAVVTPAALTVASLPAARPASGAQAVSYTHLTLPTKA